MLVFAAIVPHSPILLESIGRENTKKLKKTLQSIEDIENKLYLAKPDVLVVLSPHGQTPGETAIVFDEQYEVNFKEFGDFETRASFKAYPKLVERLRAAARKQGVHLPLQHERPLDHGIAIPLTRLTQNLPEIKILPIITAYQNDLKKHFDLGKIMKDELINDAARIAVIASADLSHALSSGAPAGFSKNAKQFDEDVQKFLETKNVAGIVKLDRNLTDVVEACGARTIALLLGIIERIHTTTQIFSYEAPFGVGYLVTNFKLP